MSARGEQLNWPFAALWASGMLVLWLISCSIQPWGSRWIAPLAVLAVAAEIATVTLRLPRWKSLPISRGWTRAYWPETTYAIDTELTWLLAWTSQLYVLASCVPLSGSLWPSSIALLLCVLAEVWLWPHAPDQWQAQVADKLHWLKTSTTLASPISQPDELADELLRSQSHGLLVDGESYQTGWAILTFEAQQKTASITCVFSPPFIVPPEVELDYEPIDATDENKIEDEIELIIDHITAAGMRVAIKRKRHVDPLRLKLLWHAIQSTADPIRRLP